jgi:hypothetical protein
MTLTEEQKFLEAHKEELLLLPLEDTNKLTERKRRKKES